LIMDRRGFLKGTAGVGLAAALFRRNWGGAGRGRGENEKSRTTGWVLGNTKGGPATQIRCPWVEGYCLRDNVKTGGTVEIKVSTNPPSKFTLDLYRMGYYGGKGGRFIERFGPLSGSSQADPSVGDVRLRECNWETSLNLTIPDEWLSGVYLGKLTEEREK